MPHSKDPVGNHTHRQAGPSEDTPHTVRHTPYTDYAKSQGPTIGNNANIGIRGFTT